MTWRQKLGLTLDTILFIEGAELVFLLGCWFGHMGGLR